MKDYSKMSYEVLDQLRRDMCANIDGMKAECRLVAHAQQAKEAERDAQDAVAQMGEAEREAMKAALGG